MARDSLRNEMINTYQKRAANYDVTANLYYLIGYPEWKYRRLTVDALRLQPGDTVVEIGCGTGLNFELYQERIGPEGRIIGVDLTKAMLEQARQRVEEEGWENVELIHQDARDYEFPANVDAIISTFALSLIPEAPEIVRRAAEALAEGGRMAVVDLQIPESWPDWAISIGMAIVKPFAVTAEWVARRPWPTIQAAMREALQDVQINTYYLDTTYVISGEARP
jgi:ubiquinone/menaquinone biosynthesis C-methylase UbiE